MALKMPQQSFYLKSKCSVSVQNNIDNCTRRALFKRFTTEISIAQTTACHPFRPEGEKFVPG